MNLRIAFAFGLLSAAATASAASLALVPIDQVAKDYTRAQRLVDVGQGRRMNLYCVGEGQPTVVFDGGGFDWSVTWALVQPALAPSTRACNTPRPTSVPSATNCCTASTGPTDRRTHVTRPCSAGGVRSETGRWSC